MDANSVSGGLGEYTSTGGSEIQLILLTPAETVIISIATSGEYLIEYWRVVDFSQFSVTAHAATGKRIMLNFMCFVGE